MDISQWSGRYHDIFLTTGLYGKYTLVNPFDLRCQKWYIYYSDITHQRCHRVYINAYTLAHT